MLTKIRGIRHPGQKNIFAELHLPTNLVRLRSWPEQR
jgi:hypothetical protein